MVGQIEWGQILDTFLQHMGHFFGPRLHDEPQHVQDRDQSHAGLWVSQTWGQTGLDHIRGDLHQLTLQRYTHDAAD